MVKNDIKSLLLCINKFIVNVYLYFYAAIYAEYTEYLKIDVKCIWEVRKQSYKLWVLFGSDRQILFVMQLR